MNDITHQRKRFKEVTIGIVIACKDGIVIGADRKITTSRGTRIKSLEDKISKLSFKDGRKLLICGSGGVDLAKRAIDEINPIALGEDVDCSLYRDMIESKISRLQLRLSDRGLQYDATLLFGMIDIYDKVIIGHITPSGLTETKNQGYFTTGIAAPYAEIVLKDTYLPEITIEEARLIVGGLINRIAQVDNDVEGMDVFYIFKGKDRDIEELNWAERHALDEKDAFSFNFKGELQTVKRKVDYWQKLLEKYEKEETDKEKQKGKK